MLAKLRELNDLPELPSGLRRYVVTVAMLGPALALSFFLSSPGGLDSQYWTLAIILTGLAVAAERFPVHLTHKTAVNVGTTVYLAMLILLPWQLPPLLVAIASLLAQCLRVRANPRVGLAEPIFNIGQTTLYVIAGALSVVAIDRLAGSSTERDLTALIAASIAMHLVNTGLVATAAGLQMGVAPFRVWWHNIALDFTPHVTLTVLGLVAVELSQASRLLLPALAIPGILIHRAVTQTVRLRVDTHEALASLVEVVELRDPYTAGHSRRVATTARLLAQELGLTAEEADLVESAARVHDIGKVAIDPAILSKTTPLDPAEWEQMKLHPVHGANVIERFAAYQDGSVIVRHHHESWDGSGYPGGLKGKEIPFGSRILAVADTFDAFTSDRPYRAGRSAAEALEVLRAGAGVHWDPEIVAAFATLLATRAGDIPVYQSSGATSLTLAPAA